MWVRSLCCYDHVDFAIGDRQHIIYSLNGAVSWWSWDLTGDRATRRTNGWGSMFIPVGGGFSGTTLTPKQFRPTSVSLDYWTLAIPLTIASALLLLSNPGPLPNWSFSLPCLRSIHQQHRVTVVSLLQVSRAASARGPDEHATLKRRRYERCRGRCGVGCVQSSNRTTNVNCGINGTRHRSKSKPQIHSGEPRCVSTRTR
jgi:hypothetical protein